MYRAIPFDEYIPTKSPNYSNPDSWAVKPGKYPESLKKIIGDSEDKNCDVFLYTLQCFSIEKILIGMPILITNR